MVGSSRPATMRDVADRAGVSQSTVSRVLSGQPGAFPISEETKQSVLRAAEELNYTPNPFARALKGSSPNLIGVLVREITDPFFAQMVSSIGQAMQDRGYSTVLGDAHSNPGEAQRFIETLDVRHCAGFMILGDLKDDEETLHKIREQRLYVVSVARGRSVPAVSSVNVDNRKGVELALHYLYDLGHRRIGFVRGGWIGDIQERSRVFLKYMLGRGLSVPEDYVQFAESNDLAGGYQAMKRLLDGPHPPTAVLVSDDSMAIGALRAAADLRVDVPKQVSVIGFDDIGAAAFSIPRLTTVRQPIAEMGSLAVHFVIDMIEGEIDHDGVEEILLEPQLIVRESCDGAP